MVAAVERHHPFPARLRLRGHAGEPGLEGQSIHDRPVVGSLDAAGPLEMVDVFRNSSHVGGVVDGAIRLGTWVTWMQRGVIDRGAASRAKAAEIAVIMDRCPVIEAWRLGLDLRAAHH